jgi:hypothetical protein
LISADVRSSPTSPRSSLPLAYFALAHAGLALALIVLAVQPDLPGAYFFHPRMVAIVHLVTLDWISGSILGALYIVAPLVLGMPMPVGRADWVAFAAFAIGTIGMVGHFWIGEYEGMVWAAALVIGTIAWVAVRAWRGLPHATAGWPVRLHVALAFGNMLAAGSLGAALGLDRSRGLFQLSPLAGAFAHAHLAAVGWALMMVVGLSYRLLPMILPAKMPTGRGIAASAMLIEGGLVAVVAGLLGQPSWLVVGGLAIAAGLASFARQMRRTFAHRVPRPPALPRRDWSTWQAQAALLWLLVAAGLGLSLTVLPPDRTTTAVAWIYGVAGLVGCLSQIIVGMQGRLIPLYVYYRAMAARGGVRPERAANDLPSAPRARLIFLTWTIGVPWLAWGLADERPLSIAGASTVLLIGVVASAAYILYLEQTARLPLARTRDLDTPSATE